MVYAQDFAEMLRSLMAERGIGVSELGRRVYRDKAYISRVASGKQRPSPEAARDIDDALGASGELAALARPADSGLADVRALALTLAPESLLAGLAAPEGLGEGADV